MSTIITDKMIEAGNAFANKLIEARCSYMMNGLGGCNDWAEWEKENEDYSDLDLILDCIINETPYNKNLFIVMERKK